MFSGTAALVLSVVFGIAIASLYLIDEDIRNSVKSFIAGLILLVFLGGLRLWLGGLLDGKLKENN